jgi:beta-lactamase superfamily II metal-dependent hydrolase
MLFDSCLNPETKEPAAISYLQSIGMNPRKSVRLIVVTHWDDDHIQGVARLVEECENATVACSLALNRKDIVQFVIEQGRAQGALGSGLDELRTILTLCRNTGRLVWAKATVPLHPRAAGGDPIVVALSPSDDAVSRSIESLIEQATGKRVTFPRRYSAPEGPNGSSVATIVRADEGTMLLGADLENSDNEQTGWGAVMAYAKPDTSASLVKIPHHGSKGAHHDAIWAEIVNEDPVAIVTPWVLAGGHLPSESDLVRLRRVAKRVYLTAMPTRGRVKKDSAVEKLITKVAGVRIEELRGWGQVRARRKPAETSWRVDLSGDARAIP